MIRASEQAVECALELISRLRYEYAVQVDFTDKGGPVAYFNYDTAHFQTSWRHATWFETSQEAENAIECEIGDEYKTTIVRRLVSEPEVAE